MEAQVKKYFSAKSAIKKIPAEKFKKSIKKGSKLYSIACWQNDDDSASVDAKEYMVTSIRYAKGDARFKHSPAVPRTVFYVRLIDYVTCRIKKDKIELFQSISPEFRRSFFEGSDLPDSVYTSKTKALDYAINDAEIKVDLYGKKIKEIKDNEGKSVDCRQESEEDCLAMIKFLKNSISKMKAMRTKLKNLD